MRIMGIDLGSRRVKVAIWEDNKFIRLESYSTMSFYRDYCNYDGKITVNTHKLGISDLDMGVSTGYGKNNTDLRDFTPINEIKAHIYGAVAETGLKDFVLLDMGGQDTKVVRVEGGVATDLDLNDKCAASCGRYLENMANVLEVKLEEMFKYHENPIRLSSTCAVFSETELIGKIAEGVPASVLCASVNFSLYNRLKPLINNFKGEILVISGGVAKNRALIEYLKEDYDKVITLKDSEFNGAKGCVMYGIRLFNI